MAERTSTVAGLTKVRLECGKRFWGLEMPRSRISHTPLFALVTILGLSGTPHMSFIFLSGGFSEIWNHFFKFNFFYVIFFAETSLGYLGTSPGPIEMVS